MKTKKKDRFEKAYAQFQMEKSGYSSSYGAGGS